MDENVLHQEFEWKNRKEEFYKRREAFNQNIEDLKIRYNDKVPSAIEQYCLLILQNSNYPFNYKKNIEIVYSIDNKILAIEYSLPIPNDLPTLKDVK